MKDKIKYIVPSAVVLLIIIYCIVILTMKERLPGGVNINGINCSFLTYEDAADKLTNNIEARKITLKNAGEEVKTISVNEYATLSYSKETMERITNSLNKAEKLFFFLYKFDYEKEPEIIINSDALNKLIKETGGTEEPKNAYIKKENGEFIVVPEENGNTIDSDTASLIIKHAIENNESEADISEAFIKAGILSTDEELNVKKDQLNADFDFKIKFVYKNGISIKTTVLEKEELASLYKTNEHGVPYLDNDGKYEIDQKAVSEYIEKTIPAEYLNEAENETKNSEIEENPKVEPNNDKNTNESDKTTLKSDKKTKEEKIEDLTNKLIKALKEHEDTNIIIE